MCALTFLGCNPDLWVHRLSKAEFETNVCIDFVKKIESNVYIDFLKQY